MQDFSFKTSKGAILKDMMGRPDTKKLIQKALSSPMGSTSRSEAKSIFSIMSKLNDKNDGVGGPGDVMNQIGYGRDSEPEQIADKPKPTKEMVVFNRIPKSRVNYTVKPTANVKDGAGGPGDGRGSYSGPSISSYLSSVGKDPSYSARAVLAANHGIQDYSGTADQNTQLLSKLRSGLASPEAKPKLYTDNFGNKSLTPFANIKSTPKIYTDLYGNRSLTPFANIKSTPKIYTDLYGNRSLTPPQKNTGTDLFAAKRGQKNAVFDAPKVNTTINKDAFGNQSIASPETYNGEEFTTKVLDDKGNFIQKPIKVKPDETGNRISLEVVNGAQGGQCGRFVNNYLGASVFGDSFKQKMSNANVTDPRAGDVVIFDIGEFGHVAVIESINPDGTLNIVGSNGDGVSETVTRNVVSAEEASGFYRPGGPTNISTPQWGVANAVSSNMGAEGYAQQNNPLPVGKTLRDSVYESYGIKEKEDLITKMETAGATLPANVTSFIKASDSALKDIDNNIAEYTADIMGNMDMSDPGNIAKAKAQLGYLYTLRARQNQTYVGYLNDAVDQHQAQLDGMVTKYGLDLKNAQEEINDGTADYERMSASLSSMYTEMKEAPELALRMSILKSEAITKEALASGETPSLDEALSYPVQKKKIQDMETITDINGYTLPNADVQSMIINNDADQNSELKPDFILRTYMDSVIKTLNAQEEEKTGQGDVISKDYKDKIAKESIQQLLGFQNSIKDDDSLAGLFNSTEYMIQDISDSYGKMYAESISEENSAKIMEAVDDLAPGGWFFGVGHGTPQEEDEFVDSVKEKTGGTLNDSIAKAIYATFKLASESFSEEGDKTAAPRQAVDSLLYNMSTTGDRENMKKRSPREFAYLLGGIIADQFVQVILRELNEYQTE